MRTWAGVLVLWSWVGVAGSSTTPSPLCPHYGWAEFRGRCYKGHCGFGGISYKDARSECQKLEVGEGIVPDLASVPNADVQDFILRTFANTKVCPYELKPAHPLFWLGLERYCPTGAYKWLHSGRNATYTNWAPGQPPALQASSCGVLNYTSGEWSATECGDYQRNYVCEYHPAGPAPSPSPTATSTDGCDPGWCSDGRRCYKAAASGSLFTRSWQSASAHCRSEGAHLASVSSPAENAFVLAMAAASGGAEAWLGLTKLASHDGTFRWSDGSPTRYANWAPGQPDSAGTFGVQLCGAMYVSKRGRESSEKGLWDDLECDGQRSFVCAKPINGATASPTPTPVPQSVGCTSDFVAFGDRCYKLVESPLGFMDAVRHCQGLSNSETQAELSSVRGPYEQAFVASLQAAAARPRDLWLGGYRTEDSGRISFWINNDQFHFTNWAVPTDCCFKTCVRMEAGSGGWVLDAWANCSVARPFVCEAEMSFGLPAPIPADLPCQAGRPCFTLAANPSDFAAAESNCVLFGGTMASFHSASELYNAILSLRNQKLSTAWVGMSDRAVDGDFRNVDGWPVGLAPWKFGEPAPGQHCVAVQLSADASPGSRLGAWLVALPCSSKQAFLCESGRAPPPSPVPAQGTCPQGWITGLNACYKLVKHPFDSGTSCISVDYECSQDTKGSIPAVFRTKADLDTFLADPAAQAMDRQYFIGLQSGGEDVNYGYNEGWKWFDGSDPGYFNWASGQGVKGVSRDSCVLMDPAGLWYTDYNDYHSFPVVCQIPKVQCPAEYCMNGGTSHWTGESCVCSCRLGFYGLRCSKAVPTTPRPTSSTEGPCSCHLLFGFCLGGSKPDCDRQRCCTRK